MSALAGADGHARALRGDGRHDGSRALHCARAGKLPLLDRTQPPVALAFAQHVERGLPIRRARQARKESFLLWRKNGAAPPTARASNVSRLAVQTRGGHDDAIRRATLALVRGDDVAVGELPVGSRERFAFRRLDPPVRTDAFDGEHIAVDQARFLVIGPQENLVPGS